MRVTQVSNVSNRKFAVCPNVVENKNKTYINKNINPADTVVFEGKLH